MRELFIYYRVPAAASAVARRAVEQLQAALCAAHPGLRARLLRRPAEGAAMQTWMETYAVVGDAAKLGITPAIEAEIASRSAALGPLLDGPRRVEVFIDDGPP